ncbi:MAG: DNA repair protein RecO [Tannerellaceae bacterium]|jgi:DNA repair protein RecO (recombination protein O)|nr:DNA repair protein RecO [Tannerellaceae bacterium]
MLSKTQGIVLHATPYSDTRLIVHIYTEDYGRTSCIAARAKDRKNSLPKALFTPLSIIEIEMEQKNGRDFAQLREVKLLYPFANLFADPVKNALALFVAEVLFRVVRETAPDRRLFAFLTRSIHVLEDTGNGIANFHLAFLLRLLAYLGISPNADAYRDGVWFDMQDGVFVDTAPMHKHFLDKAESRILARLLRISYENMSLYAFSRHQRILILNKLITYYRLHLPEVPEIKSLPILQSLFD